MDQEMVITLAQEVIKTILLLAAPMLGIGLIVGLTVSLFQAVTQINEITLTYVPKIVAILAAILIASPWMIQVLTTFSRELIINIPGYIN